MAITASLACTPSSVTNPLSWTVACTISNGNATDCTVTALEPSLVATSGATTQSTACALGRPAINPGASVNVPASGTLVLTWGVTAFSPAGSSSGFPTSPASQTYTNGATVWTSDGSVTIASTASVVVTARTAT